MDSHGTRLGTAGNTARRTVTTMAVALTFAGACCFSSRAATETSQNAPAPAQRETHIGDVLATTASLAKLSPALTTNVIDKAVRKVGNWQLNPVGPNDDAPANDHAVGQTYLDLYQIYHQRKMMLLTKETLDAQMKVADVPGKPVWWWCDALSMGPPTWARLYRATRNRAYLDYMDREFWITSNLLYRPQEKLYSRDATYLNARSKNGQLIFWSRGNGWVMAGIARTLDDMPKDYPSRSKYVEQFKQMASRIATLQGADGLWRTDLLDPAAYPTPEVSGSAFYVYALAWGINHGILDSATYLPVVKKGWKGLLAHVYQDGRLGAIQSVNSEPGVVPPTSSYVYGVGGFLMAGGELHRLAERSAGHGSPAAFDWSPRISSAVGSHAFVTVRGTNENSTDAGCHSLPGHDHGAAARVFPAG